ncbi:hypothetical protein YC2023_089115 [Brassica napus]
MQGATHPHTCRSACFDCMRRDISCLADPPRAPHGWLHVHETCRTPPLLPDVRLHDWNSCKAPQHHTHGWPHASVACAETPCAWSIHLVLLHVKLHVQLPCKETPRASVDTQLAGWFTPRSEPMQQATSSFSFRGKLHAEETSFFQNVELLNRRASKSFMLRKHPSHQSKTSSNYGRATYSTHSSLTITSDRPRSTDQYMEPNQHGDQNVLKISTEVHVFPHTDRTLYWTVPHASGWVLWLEPWPDDRFDRTIFCIHHTVFHFMKNSRDEIAFGRNSEIGHRYSILDCTVRTARATGLELLQNSRPDDRIPRTESWLSRPVLHSKKNGRGRFLFDRMDFKLGRATSFPASLDCPDRVLALSAGHAEGSLNLDRGI